MSCLTVEDLKVIRCALNKYPSARVTSQAIMGVDAELAKHNLKFEMEAKPKRKWQRDTTYDYVFNPINK
jgi:hypothetical protein